MLKFQTLQYPTQTTKQLLCPVQLTEVPAK